jgi:hypothetical protein
MNNNTIEEAKSQEKENLWYEYNNINQNQIDLI